MKNNVAYGISWIPVNLIKSFLKTDWNFLDYSMRQLTYDEVNKKRPSVIITFRPPPNQLLEKGNVKWIISPGAGVDNIPLDEIRNLNITLINNHANSSTVAEHAWALILNAAKKINKYDAIVRSQGLWPDRSSQIKDVNMELEGKTIGILGYGPIARKIENYANAFSMDTIIFRKNPNTNQFHFTQLLEEAENLDVLILACPLTSETKKIISEDIVENLPAHCIIVNIARGELIDEEVVFDALKEGKINSYASDVWIDSPLQEKSMGTKPLELIEVPNLIISPHRAWISKESHIKVAEQIAIELDNIARGVESSNIVDLLLEY